MKPCTSAEHFSPSCNVCIAAHSVGKSAGWEMLGDEPWTWYVTCGWLQGHCHIKTEWPWRCFMHVQFKRPDLQHSRENKGLGIKSTFVFQLLFSQLCRWNTCCLWLKKAQVFELRASAITETHVTIRTALGPDNVQCREMKWMKLN